VISDGLFIVWASRLKTLVAVALEMESHESHLVHPRHSFSDAGDIERGLHRCLDKNVLQRDPKVTKSVLGSNTAGTKGTQVIRQDKASHLAWWQTHCCHTTIAATALQVMEMYKLNLTVVSKKNLGTKPCGLESGPNCSLRACASCIT
jgi:hypothetical protein